MLSTVLLVASPLASAEHLADTVTVTAPVIDPTLPDLESARVRVQQTPGGVGIVDAEDYRDGRVSTLTDALAAATGVFAQTRFGAEEARLSIRGSGLQRIYHGRGLLMLQDGVPTNTPDGEFEAQLFEPMALRYVEVYRGANAFQFGATTLGGAINMVSLSGRDAPGFFGRVEAGSFGYRRAGFGLGTAWERGDALITATESYQDGYRDHSQQNTQRVSANVGLDLGGGLRTRFFFTGVNSESELPGSLSYATARMRPRAADPDTISQDWKRDVQYYRVANRTTYTFAPGTELEVSTYASARHIFHPITNFVGAIDTNTTDYGLYARMQQSGHLAGMANTLRYGVYANQGDGTDDRFVNDGGRPDPSKRLAGARLMSSNMGVFVEDQLNATERLSLFGGGTWVRSRREYRDRFFGDAADPDRFFNFGGVNFTARLNRDFSIPLDTRLDDSLDRTYDRWIPRLGTKYAVTPAVDVFANWSGSFEPPSFLEAAATLPNRAQRGNTFELGTRGAGSVGQLRTAWDVALYRADLRGELLELNFNGAPQTVNADKTIHQGIEAGLVLGVRAFDWRTNLLWNDFKFDGDAQLGNNRLAGLPEAIVNTELRWNGPARLYVAPSVLASTSTWIDHANTLKAPGYALLNLRVGQRQPDGWGWFVEGRNLLDHRYIASSGVIVDAREPGANLSQFNPGEGIAVFAGIEFRPTK
jgi:iron complex outermembrane receptor protein